MNEEKNRFNVEEHTTLDGRIIDVFPISHRYIHNLEQQCKKQKEINKKAIEYIKNNLIVSSILDGKKYYSLNDYGFDYKELLQILENKGD